MALLAFFVLAYGLSWASFYALGGPAIFTLGPLLAAIIVSASTGGAAGVRSMFGRLVRWRVGPTWYAAAALVPIAIGTLAVAVATFAAAPVMRLGRWYEPFVLFLVLLITGDTFCEEAGWRAFALPRFSAERSRLANTLFLGMLLAGWHLPVALSESGALVPYLLATLASAVVTNWVYYNGSESALLAWLYHTFANTTGQYLGPSFTGADRVAYVWALAGVNVVAAAVLIAATGADLRREREAS